MHCTFKNCVFFICASHLTLAVVTNSFTVHLKIIFNSQMYCIIQSLNIRLYFIKLKSQILRVENFNVTESNGWDLMQLQRISHKFFSLNVFLLYLISELLIQVWQKRKYTVSVPLITLMLGVQSFNQQFDHQWNAGIWQYSTG